MKLDKTSNSHQVQNIDSKLVASVCLDGFITDSSEGDEVSTDGCLSQTISASPPDGQSGCRALPSTFLDSTTDAVFGRLPELPRAPIQIGSRKYVERTVEGALLLAHAVLDTELNGTALQGASTRDIVGFVLNVLQNCEGEESSPGISALCTMFQGLYKRAVEIDELQLKFEGAPQQKREAQEQLYRLATQYSQEIGALAEGETYLLRGGWNEQFSGHGMLYAFRKEEGKFCVDVYNVGCGTDPYHNCSERSGKTLIDPIASFSCASVEEVFGPGRNDPTFLVALLEQVVLPQHAREDAMAKRIYVSILSNYLTPEESVSDHPLITPQRSGTCGYSVCMAVLRRYLPYVDYKMLQTRIKAELVVEDYGRIADLASHSSEAGAARLLLKKGAEKTLKRIAKLYDDERFSAHRPELLQRAAYMRAVLKELEQIEKRVDEIRVRSSLIARVPDTPPMITERMGPWVAPAPRISLEPATKLIPIATDEISVERLFLVLEDFNKEVLSPSSVDRVHSGHLPVFLSFIDRLPLPDAIEDHKKLCGEEALASMRILAEFSERLVTTVRSGRCVYKRFTSQEKYAFLKIYCLQLALARAIDRKLESGASLCDLRSAHLSRYGADNPLGTLTRYQLGIQDREEEGELTYTFADEMRVKDPRHIRELKALLDYLSSLSPVQEEGEKTPYFSCARRSEDDLREIEEFLRQLVSEDPQLKNESLCVLHQEMGQSIFLNCIGKYEEIGASARYYALSLLQGPKTAGIAKYAHVAMVYRSLQILEKISVQMEEEWPSFIERKYLMDGTISVAFTSGERASQMLTAVIPCADETAAMEAKVTTQQRTPHVDAVVELLRLASSKEHAQELMVCYLTAHIDSIKDPCVQKVFDFEMFRYDRIDAIAKNRSLLTCCETLIEAGLQWWEAAGDKRVQLFLLGFGMQIRSLLYAKDQESAALFAPCMDEPIDALERGILSAEETEPFFVTHLALARALLLITSCNSISPARICALWMIKDSMSSQQGQIDLFPPFYDKVIELGYKELASIQRRLHSFPGRRKEFCAEVVKILLGRTVQVEHVTYKSDLLCRFVCKGSTQEWTIDVLKGKVWAGTGDLVASPLCRSDLVTDPAFTKLFGDVRGIQEETAHCSTFVSPKLQATFRFFTERRDVKDTTWVHVELGHAHIMHTFADFGECVFLLPQHLENRSFPVALLHGYTHWLTKGGELVLCPFDTLRPMFKMDRSKMIRQVSPPFHVIETHQAKDTKVFFSIEAQGGVIVERGDMQRIVAVTYPFCSFQGRPIRFQESNGAFVAAFDGRYKLDQDPVEGVFKDCIDYLSLETEEGERALLIPLANFSCKSLPSPQVQIVRPASMQSMGKDPMPVPCMLFSLKGREPEARDNAGLLYLGLLYLQEKSYDKAIRCLLQLHHSLTIDPELEPVLKLYRKQLDLFREPNAAAVLLHLEAYLRLHRSSLYVVYGLLSLYRSQISHVYDGLRLSEEKLKILGVSPSREAGKKTVSTVYRKPQEAKDLIRYYEASGLAKSFSPCWEAMPFECHSDGEQRSVLWQHFLRGYSRLKTGDALERKKLLVSISREVPSEIDHLLGLLSLADSVDLPPLPANMTGGLRSEEHTTFFQTVIEIATRTYERTKGQGPVLHFTSRKIEEGVFECSKPIRRGCISDRMRYRDLPSVDLTETDEENFLLPAWESFYTLSARGGEYVLLSKQVDRSIPIEEGENFQSCIADAVDRYVEETSRGAELLCGEPLYGQKDSDSSIRLQEELTQHKKRLEEEVRDIDARIILQVNRTSSPWFDREIVRSLELFSGHHRVVDIEECYLLFLQGSRARFLEVNDLLVERDFYSIVYGMAMSLHAKTTIQHIDRIVLAIAEGRHADAGALLAQRRAYDAAAHPDYLIFEYFSHLRLRPEQVFLLERLGSDSSSKDKGIIGQLMMGGGKTKVLAALHLFSTAASGRLPVFVVPAELYTTVLSDISASMQANFSKVILGLDFTRADLEGVGKCRDIYNAMERALDQGRVILTKPHTMQILFLQYFYALDTGKQDTAIVLREILVLLQEKGDFLIDEVHKVLAQKREVNYPKGNQAHPLPIYIDLIKEMFLQISQDARLLDKIGFTQQRQSLLPLEEYQSDVLPELIRYMLMGPFKDACEETGLSTDALARYLGGEKVEEVEQALALCHRSAEDRKRVFAELIPLASYVISSLFPMTLQKTYRRHYGPLPSSMVTGSHSYAGKIVPYESSDTPAPTVFSSWIEESLYEFTSAFIDPISTDVLQVVVEEYDRRVAMCKGLGRTDILRPLLEITGEDLTELRTEEGRRRALAHINEDRVRKILCRAEFMKCSITYFPEQMTSGPQNWYFSSISGLSGTPFNRRCYLGTLGREKNFVSDSCVEGKIIASFLTKAKEKCERGERAIHVVASTKAEVLLRHLCQEHPHRSRIRGFQDAAGFFKEESTIDVAKAFLSVMEEKMPELDGVLFFYVDPVTRKDRLAYLEKGSTEPRFLAGSSLKDLKGAGIQVDKVFTFYDERHTTGVDIPQMDDAIHFISIDYRQDVVSVLQSILRLRKFVLGGQSVEMVITEAHAEKMPSDANGIILHLMQNLAVEQSKQLYQAMHQKVDAIIQEALLTQILAQDRDDQAELYRQFRPFFVSPLFSSPYESFCLTSTKIESPQEVSNYIDKRLQDLSSAVARGTYLFASIEDRLTDLREEVEQSARLLPQFSVEYAGSSSERMQTEEQSVEVTQTAEEEIENEIARERMNGRCGIVAQKDVGFDFAPYRRVDGARPRSLVSVMERYGEYTECFDEDILVTDNFLLYAEGSSTPLSPFHWQQKPATAILVERQQTDGEEKYRFTFVSLAETDCLTQSLPSFYRDRIATHQLWLVSIDGNILVRPPERYPNIRGCPPLNRALVQASLFNGDLHRLHLLKEQGAKAFLEEKPAIRMQMLTMKAPLALNIPWMSAIGKVGAGSHFGHSATMVRLTLHNGTERTFVVRSPEEKRACTFYQDLMPKLDAAPSKEDYVLYIEEAASIIQDLYDISAPQALTELVQSVHSGLVKGKKRYVSPTKQPSVKKRWPSNQGGCSGWYNTERSKDLCKMLNRTCSDGVHFHDKTLTGSLSGGACTALSLLVASQYAALKRMRLFASRDDLVSFIMRYLKVSDDTRAIQAALNAIEALMKEGRDVSRAKMEAMTPLHGQKVECSYGPVHLGENLSSKEELRKVLSTLPDGVYIVRSILPAHNKKLEEWGHSTVLIKEEGDIYFYDPNCGMKKISPDRFVDTVFKMAWREGHLKFNVPMLRIYKLSEYGDLSCELQSSRQKLHSYAFSPELRALFETFKESPEKAVSFDAGHLHWMLNNTDLMRHLMQEGISFQEIGSFLRHLPPTDGDEVVLPRQAYGAEHFRCIVSLLEEGISLEDLLGIPEQVFELLILKEGQRLCRSLLRNVGREHFPSLVRCLHAGMALEDLSSLPRDNLLAILQSSDLLRLAHSLNGRWELAREVGFSAILTKVGSCHFNALTQLRHADISQQELASFPKDTLLEILQNADHVVQFEEEGIPWRNILGEDFLPSIVDKVGTHRLAGVVRLWHAGVLLQELDSLSEEVLSVLSSRCEARDSDLLALIGKAGSYHFSSVVELWKADIPVSTLHALPEDNLRVLLQHSGPFLSSGWLQCLWLSIAREREFPAIVEHVGVMHFRVIDRFKHKGISPAELVRIPKDTLRALLEDKCLENLLDEMDKITAKELHAIVKFVDAWVPMEAIVRNRDEIPPQQFLAYADQVHLLTGYDINWRSFFNSRSLLPLLEKVGPHHFCAVAKLWEEGVFPLDLLEIQEEIVLETILRYAVEKEGFLPLAKKVPKGAFPHCVKLVETGVSSEDLSGLCPEVLGIVLVSAAKINDCNEKGIDWLSVARDERLPDLLSDGSDYRRMSFWRIVHLVGGGHISLSDLASLDPGVLLAVLGASKADMDTFDKEGVDWMAIAKDKKLPALSMGEAQQHFCSIVKLCHAGICSLEELARYPRGVLLRILPLADDIVSLRGRAIEWNSFFRASDVEPFLHRLEAASSNLLGGIITLWQEDFPLARLFDSPEYVVEKILQYVEEKEGFLLLLKRVDPEHFLRLVEFIEKDGSPADLVGLGEEELKAALAGLQKK